MAGRLGFIGLGAMGFPMTRLLAAAGHGMTVFDADHAALDQAGHIDGVVAAPSIAAAAASMAEVEDGREFQLRLLVPREEATRVTDLLRRARPGKLPEGVALRLPAAGPTAPATPPEGTPRGQQVVK